MLSTYSNPFWTCVLYNGVFCNSHLTTWQGSIRCPIRISNLIRPTYLYVIYISNIHVSPLIINPNIHFLLLLLNVKLYSTTLFYYFEDSNSRWELSHCFIIILTTCFTLINFTQHMNVVLDIFWDWTFFKYFMTFVSTHLCGMGNGHMGVTHMSQANKLCRWYRLNVP